MAQYVKNLIAGLSKRERRLVIATGLTFVALVIFLSVFFVQLGIRDLEEEGQSYKKALDLIAKEEGNYLETKRMNQQEQQKGLAKPTPLRTLVDKIAKQLDVTVPDVKELPEQHHGSKWIEHSVELSMRQIGIVNLTRFMEEVERNRKKFPIAITKLEVRNQRRSQDTYNIKMVVSTYEQIAQTNAPGKRPAGSPPKGGV